MNYPPFCDLVQFTVSDTQEQNAYSNIQLLYKIINEKSQSSYSDIPIRMLYPTAPKILKFNGKYRYNLVIKSKVCNRLYEMLWDVINYFENNVKSALSVNVNPINNI